MALRYSSEHQSLRATTPSKFGQVGNVWTPNNVKQSSHQSPWKRIIQVLPFFLPFTKLSLGSGNTNRFLFDP